MIHMHYLPIIQTMEQLTKKLTIEDAQQEQVRLRDLSNAIQTVVDREMSNGGKVVFSGVVGEEIFILIWQPDPGMEPA